MFNQRWKLTENLKSENDPSEIIMVAGKYCGGKVWRCQVLQRDLCLRRLWIPGEIEDAWYERKWSNFFLDFNRKFYSKFPFSISFFDKKNWPCLARFQRDSAQLPDRGRFYHGHVIYRNELYLLGGFSRRGPTDTVFRLDDPVRYKLKVFLLLIYYFVLEMNGRRLLKWKTRGGSSIQSCFKIEFGHVAERINRIS